MAETDPPIDAPNSEAEADGVLGANVPVYSVSEISQALKRTVEEQFSYVKVRGEISRMTLASSGHMYLTLKDETSVLSGICWRGTVGRLSIKPEDGMEVIATGRLSTYPGRSNYQIIIESMELAGEGALLKLLEDRRQKLLAEGLFDPEKKNPLPYIPEVIGVITSPTGAVIKDILHRLDDRFPRHVLLWPARVQGDGAAEEVAGAIHGFNRMTPGGPVPRPDLIIVARGGGSLEDLWAFNEEIVVRAAAESDIPLISAVGHETDTTLIDFASDQRAPTPTAAAEMAVPVRSELLGAVGELGVRIYRGVTQILDTHKTILVGLARGIPEPSRLLEDASQRLDDRGERLIRAIRQLHENKVSEVGRFGAFLQPRALAERAAASGDRLADLDRRARMAIKQFRKDRAATLDSHARLLESFSYERVLDRGFSLTTDEKGQPITSVTQATPGANLTIRFHDGSVGAEVQGAGKPKPSGKKPVKKSKPENPQGSLL
jgi:exodeoxyribonuclease VII large subunit